MKSSPRTEFLAASAAAFFLLLPGVFWGLPTGKFIVGARVILDGGLPYRDFWTMYAPGSFYLVAGLLGLSGGQLIVPGIAAVLLRAVSAGLFFRLLRRVGAGPVVSASFTLIFVGMFWTTAPEIESYPPALLLLLLAWRQVVRFQKDAEPRAAFLAGLFCGLAAWFKHDVGAYAALATGIGLLFAGAGFRTVLRVGAGAVAPVLPVALLLGLAVGPEAADGLLLFPLHTFAHVFSEPYPTVLPDFGPALANWAANPSDLAAGRDALDRAATWIVGYAPAIAFLGGLAWWLRARAAEPAARGLVAVALCWMPFFWQAAHVQRNTHIFTMAVLSLLIVATIRATGRSGIHASALPPGRRTRRWMVPLAVTAGVLVYAVGLAATPAMNAFLVAHAWPGRPVNLPGTQGLRASATEVRNYTAIVRAVQQRTDPDDPLYVGLARHDAPVISNLRFWYLTQRRGATRYYELHPGVIDTPAVQKEIIAALKENAVRQAILWKFGWPDARLDRIRDARRRALPDIGATALDAYLTTRFDTELQAGEFALLRRNASP